MFSRVTACIPVPHAAFVACASESGTPHEVDWLLDYLFSTVLSGRNAHLADGIERALAHALRDFADYARETAATGIWNRASA